MSDEYSSTGYDNSLVNDTAGSTLPSTASDNKLSNSDYETSNYPPKDDTTSSGGYRGGPAEEQPSLIDQSPSGGQLGGDLQDARQGSDLASAQRAGGEGNAYGEQSLDSRGAAEGRLASDFRDRRGEGFEGSGARGGDSDFGA